MKLRKIDVKYTYEFVEAPDGGWHIRYGDKIVGGVQLHHGLYIATFLQKFMTHYHIEGMDSRQNAEAVARNLIHNTLSGN